jgi:hypothetical protein
MPEVSLTVNDLYRIIGQKEVVIAQLNLQILELQRELVGLRAQMQAPIQRGAHAGGPGNDGQPA